jgi:hypothetical protein
MKIRKLIQSGVVALVLMVNAAWAAEETNQQARSGSATQIAEPEPGFDISFPGGTLEEFTAHVQKAFAASVRGAKPNLIVPPEARKVSMPKLELRSVDMRTLIAATTMLLQPEHMWQSAGNKSGGTWVLITRADVRKTQAYYIGHLLKKFKVADITTALDTVWQMGSNAKTEIKYHEDTQMLIIRADRAQLETAENVLNQLRGALAADELKEDQERARKATPAPTQP